MVYIRFGKPPRSGRSGIYKRGRRIGTEEGLSVYDAVYNSEGWHVILPTPLTETIIGSLCSLYDRVKSNKCKVFLIEGIEVGKGTDGEPLITDFNILEDITNSIVK